MLHYQIVVLYILKSKNIFVTNSEGENAKGVYLFHYSRAVRIILF